MPIGFGKRFRYKGKEYIRCRCGMVGLANWAHAHAKDVDGHVYGSNWYRSVEELERRLSQHAIAPDGSAHRRS